MVYLQAAHGSAGLAVAAGAFDDLGITPLVIDLNRRAAGDQLAVTLAIVTREAGLTGRGLVLGGADVVAAVDSTLWEQVADAPIPVIAVGVGRWDAEWLRWLPFTVESTAAGPVFAAEHLAGRTGAGRRPG